MDSRKNIGIVMAEIIGTFTLALVVLTQVHAAGAVVASPWFIGLAAGLTLAVLVLAIGRVSGAHYNPAVTIGLWSIRKVDGATAFMYIAAQMFGGIIALMLFQYLSNTTVGNIAGSFEWRIFVAEAVGTLIFTHGIASVVLQKLTGFKAAFTIGLSLMAGVIVATVASNGALNPAVALSLNSWSWTYVLAPVIGSLLGFNIYNLFFAPERALLEQSEYAAPRSASTTRTTVVTKKKRR